MQRAVIGLFGVGLDTYWEQFPDLLVKLKKYQAHIRERLEGLDCVVVDAGLVDSLDRAHEAAGLFAREGVHIIFLYVSTYALSATVLPVVQAVKAPVVVLNLQPEKAIPYAEFNAMKDRGRMTGVWLGYCQACSAPEIACVFNRAGITYNLVTGWIDDPEAWREIGEWVAAARTVQALRETRIGLLGHYYCGMLDVYADLTRLTAVFGSHFEIVEMCELHRLREAASDESIEAKLRQFGKEFAVEPACGAAELRRAAQTSVALDALVENNRLGALAYYYEGEPGNEYENIVTSLIAGNTLLTAHHVPVAGEYEVRNVIAMKIMDILGAGGSFSEFYAMDFNDDVVMWGHDGPAHVAIAEGDVKLVPLPVYHGKPGKGLSIEMRVKTGPVTVLAVVHDGGGKIGLLVAEGEAVPGPILEIGNTNSRYRFPGGAKNFVNRWCEAGPAHHAAVGIGQVAGAIEKTGRLLGLPVTRIC